MHEEMVASDKERNICCCRFKNANWRGSETYPKIGKVIQMNQLDATMIY